MINVDAANTWSMWERRVFDALEVLDQSAFLGISHIEKGLPVLTSGITPDLRTHYSEYVACLSQQDQRKCLNMQYHITVDAPTYNVVMGIVGARPSILSVLFYDVYHLHGHGIPFFRQGDNYRVIYSRSLVENDNLADDVTAISRLAIARMHADLAMYK